MNTQPKSKSFRGNLSIRIDSELRQRLHDWMVSQPVSPRLTDVVERAIDEFLIRNENHGSKDQE